MDAELLEIRQHMGRHPPFDRISDELLDEVAGSVEVAYFKAGTPILEADQPIEDLCYIRSGAVEVYRRNGNLFDRLGEGDIFGHFSLLRNQRVRFPVSAIEDTLIYFIPRGALRRLCEADEHFADFVELGRPRLKAVVEEQRKNNEMMVARVRKLITRPPLIVEATDSVQEAARRVTEGQASAVLVVDAVTENPRYTYTDNDGRQWQVRGILTDTDFRARVVAEGLPPETAVGEVVGDRLVAVQSDESIHEAMLCMLRSNVHHLPVMHRRRPIGIVHLSDLIRYETHSSLYLVDAIFSRNSAEELAGLLPEVRATFVRMVRDGADSRMVGSALSTIGRSFTRRLLELAEQELGPPPVRYAFMALGSMARNEQSIVSDQDNALVLGDDFDPARHDAYFLELARRVSDGLAACGYTYCKGDVMATNPRWRQPLSVWRQYFSDWIDHPTPERLLHSNIFFDLDSVYGENPFVESLQDLVAERAKNSELFLAAMARNALNRTPPLGFFRDFVMEKDGKHNNSINVKRRGTAPLVDLIRVHALACGSRAQNSFERLDDIGRTQLLGPGVGDRLREALEFLSISRIRHQVVDLENEREPDNNIEPENVPATERRNLKEAFQALSNAQKFLKFRYPMPAGR
ncbi:DUF294 nucleotidyltransferase-like domain-containing protein [Arhodomonas sp. SL1]|uniref:DUF294 nucleotidyltransferase-like domain-containing protein n=1 Tax=Arhodomonas sp. SL1 TaxID=3425691 RepID=UPI003F8816BA